MRPHGNKDLPPIPLREVKCAGGCGKILRIPKRHQGADNNKYTCFNCSEKEY